MQRIRPNLVIVSLLLLPLTSCDAPEEGAPEKVRSAAKQATEVAILSASDVTARAAHAKAAEAHPAKTPQSSMQVAAVAEVTTLPPAVDFPLPDLRPAKASPEHLRRTDPPKHIAQTTRPVPPPQPARVVQTARPVALPKPVQHSKPREHPTPVVRAEPVGSERSTPEGIEALRRVTEAYHAHLTYRAATRADITVKYDGARTYTRDSLLAYGQAPGRALLQVHDTLGGSDAFYADGRSVCHYREQTNDFTQVQTPAGMAGIVARIDGDMPLLFSPLSFVVAKERPACIETARVVGEEMLGSRPVLVLTGRLSAAAASRTAASMLGRELPVKERAYRLWIDRITSLVVKSETRLSWSAPGGASLLIVEQTREPELGISLPPDTFAFPRPPRSHARLAATR